MAWSAHVAIGNPTKDEDELGLHWSGSPHLWCNIRYFVATVECLVQYQDGFTQPHDEKEKKINTLVDSPLMDFGRHT